MTAVEFGSTPIDITANLTRGQDFVARLTRPDDTDWPVGVSVSLVFNDSAQTTWLAAANGPDLDWSVDKAQVDDLISRRPSAVRLLYVEGTTELVWGTGGVAFHG